eukprot:6188641-Pleurochrysis_carterae.AAC.1
MSYISGSVPEAIIGSLYANAFKALKPKGKLIVHDFMVNDSLDGPPLGATRTHARLLLARATRMSQGSRRAQTHAQTHSRAHKRTDTRAHTRTRAHTHARTHAHARARAHQYTSTPPLSAPPDKGRHRR